MQNSLHHLASTLKILPSVLTSPLQISQNHRKVGVGNLWDLCSILHYYYREWTAMNLVHLLMGSALQTDSWNS